MGKTLVHQQLAEWDQHCSLLEGQEVWAVAMAAKVLLGQQCQRNRTLGTHMEKKLQEKTASNFCHFWQGMLGQPVQVRPSNAYHAWK